MDKKESQAHKPHQFLEIIRAEEICIQEEIEHQKLLIENKVSNTQVQVNEIRKQVVENARKTRKEMIKEAIDASELKSKARIAEADIEAAEIIKKGKKYIEEGVNFVISSIFIIPGESIKK